ncbi:MAG TPA: hypothetical protein VIJ07_26425 [Dermatophilaceae bacterium]
MTSETPPLREGDAANTPKISGAVSPEASAPPMSQGAATLSPSAHATTRAAAAWFATVVALVLLVLLIVLILQNQDVVKLHYLGFTGSLPLGTALFIAAVAGVAVVAIPEERPSHKASTCCCSGSPNSNRASLLRVEVGDKH